MQLRGLHTCIFLGFIFLLFAYQPVLAQSDKKIYKVNADRKQKKVKLPKNKKREGTTDNYKRPRSKQNTTKGKDTYKEPKTISRKQAATDNYNPPRTITGPGGDKDHYRQPRTKTKTGATQDHYQEPKTKTGSGVARDQYKLPRSKSRTGVPRDTYSPPATIPHSGVVRDTYKRPPSISDREQGKVTDAKTYSAPPLGEGKKKDITPEVPPNYPSVYYKFNKIKKADTKNSDHKMFSHEGDIITRDQLEVDRTNKSNANRVTGYQGSFKRPTQRAETRYFEKQSEQIHQFNGSVKIRKPGKDMHPSVEYLEGKTKNSYAQKEAQRKRALFFSRIFRKSDQPKHLDEKERKPRYDKNESEIWYY